MINVGDTVIVKDDCMYSLIRGRTAVVVGEGCSKSTVACWFESMDRGEDVCVYGTQLHNCDMTEERYRGKCLYLHRSNLMLANFWNVI